MASTGNMDRMMHRLPRTNRYRVYHSYRCYPYSLISFLLLHLLQSCHVSGLESHNHSLASRFAYAPQLIPEYNNWRAFVDEENRRKAEMLRDSIAAIEDELDLEEVERRIKKARRKKTGDSDNAESNDMNLLDDEDQSMEDDDGFPYRLFADLDFNTIDNIDNGGGEDAEVEAESPVPPPRSPEVITLDDSRSSSPADIVEVPVLESTRVNFGSPSTSTTSTLSPIIDEIASANTVISELVQSLVEKNRGDTDNLIGVSSQGSSPLSGADPPPAESQVAPGETSIGNEQPSPQDSSNELSVDGIKLKHSETVVDQTENDADVNKPLAIVLPSFQNIVSSIQSGGTFREVIGIDGSRQYAIDGGNPFEFGEKNENSPNWKSIDFSDMEAIEVRTEKRRQENDPLSPVKHKRLRRSLSPQEEQFGLNPPPEVRSNLLQQYLTAPQSFRPSIEQFEGQQMSNMPPGPTKEGYFQQQMPLQQPIPLQRQVPVAIPNRSMSTISQTFIESHPAQQPFQGNFVFKEPIPMRENRVPNGVFVGPAMGQGVGPQSAPGVMGNQNTVRIILNGPPQMNPSYNPPPYGVIPQNGNIQMNPQQLNQYLPNGLPNGNAGQGPFRQVPGNNFGQPEFPQRPAFQPQPDLPGRGGDIGPPRPQQAGNMQGPFVNANQGSVQFQGLRQMPLSQRRYQMVDAAGMRQDARQFAGTPRPQININMGVRLPPATVEMQWPPRPVGGQIPPGFPGMSQIPSTQFTGMNGAPVNQGMNPAPRYVRPNDMGELGPNMNPGRASGYFSPIQPAPYAPAFGAGQRSFEPSAALQMNYPRMTETVRPQPFYVQQNLPFASENLGARATNSEFLQGRPNEGSQVIPQPRIRPNVAPYQIPEKYSSGQFNRPFEPQPNFTPGPEQGRYFPAQVPFQRVQQLPINPTSVGFAYVGTEGKPEPRNGPESVYVYNRPQIYPGNQLATSQFPQARPVDRSTPQGPFGGVQQFIARPQNGLQFQGNGYPFNIQGDRNIAAATPGQRVIDTGRGGPGPNVYSDPRSQTDQNFSGLPGTSVLGPKIFVFPTQPKPEQLSRHPQQQPHPFNTAPGFHVPFVENRNGFSASGNGGRGVVQLPVRTTDQSPTSGGFVIPIIDRGMGRINIQQSPPVRQEQSLQFPGGVPNRVDNGQPQNSPLPSNGGYNLVVNRDGIPQLRQGPGNRVNYGDAPPAPGMEKQKPVTSEQDHGKISQVKKHLPHHGGDMPLHSQSELDNHHRRMLNNATTAEDSKFENNSGVLSWYIQRAREELRGRQKSSTDQKPGEEARPSSQGNGQGSPTIHGHIGAVAIQQGNFSAAQLPIATASGLPSPASGAQAVERLSSAVQLSPSATANRGLFAVPPASPMVQKPEDEKTVDGRAATNGVPSYANQNGLSSVSRSASSSPISPPVSATFANAIFGNGTHVGGTGATPGIQQNGNFGGTGANPGIQQIGNFGG